jgi:hypothetical protein
MWLTVISISARVKRRSRTRNTIRRLVCGVVVVTVGAGFIVGCGGGSSSAVVVRFGDHLVLTADEVDRWTHIEGATVYEPAILAHETRSIGAVPPGAVPDPPKYSRCVAFLRSRGVSASGGAKLTPTQLLGECEKEWSRFRDQILEILITGAWNEASAAELGITATVSEARRRLLAKYPSPASLKRFLAVTGMSEADEERLLKRTIVSDKLQRHAAASAHSPSEALERQARFFLSVSKKWTPQTQCRPGYVVSQCREHGSSR